MRSEQAIGKKVRVEHNDQGLEIPVKNTCKLTGKKTLRQNLDSSCSDMNDQSVSSESRSDFNDSDEEVNLPQ